MTSGLQEFWNSLGHPVQAVCFLLGVMSVVSIAVVIERRYGLWAAQKDSDRFVPLARAALKSRILAEILPLATACALSPEAEIVRRSGAELEDEDVTESQANRRLILARWRIDRYLARLNVDFRRGLSILGTVSATAPFVGLFGTVLGIIRAFRSMAPEGGGLGGVSQGIAEALIVTAVGLFVAIPATWAYNLLTHRAERAIRRARRFSGTFLEALAATGGASTRKLLLEHSEPVTTGPGFSHLTIRSEINVTPLVDVVLVLLIIFMVVTPPPQSVLDLGISKVVSRVSAGGGEPEKEQVLLRVTADNELFVNDRPVSRKALAEELRTSLKKDSGEPLFFEADPLADYVQIVQILDQCSSAGVQHIAIISRENRSP